MQEIESCMKFGNYYKDTPEGQWDTIKHMFYWWGFELREIPYGYEGDRDK